MTTFFVGPGGNDTNDGLTWANRFLTLNGAEDEPVVAADTVYVGPGVYRETLTIDVTGTDGNIITYIGDVTGENTDDIGGIVRVTGSDNDQTQARTRCINASAMDYRTFRGFSFDMASTEGIFATNCDSWVIEGCFFQDRGSDGIEVDATSINWTIKRCIFTNCLNTSIFLDASSEIDSSGHVVTNCLFVSHARGVAHIDIDRFGDVIVRNCTCISGGKNFLEITGAPNAGHPCLVNNCIIQGCDLNGLEAISTADITENYNTFFNNATDVLNVTEGANSQTYPALFVPPLLHSGASQASGFKFPWRLGELSEWSQVAAITGSNEQSIDLFGIVRPTVAAKNSWGAIQFRDTERETGTVDAGSVSIAIHDAGSHQIFVPVTNVSTTIAVQVQRESSYAGTNPRMVIKQPGQADDTTTDAAAASQWNELTTTLTPAADPPYVVIELQSLNTATSGSFDVFFDTLTVS